MKHVVYCDKNEQVLEKIIKGSKTMIIRSGESRKIPHSRVFKGEKLYFCEKGSNLINYEAEVKEVYNYSKLLASDIKKILKQYHNKLDLTINQEEKHHKKCMCLIEFTNLKKIDLIKIRPQAPLIDWIILKDINDIRKRD